MDTSLGPYRFKYADDGLAIYKLGDLVEQYFLCDEHFWFQVLRVENKTFKFRVSTHTKEEQRVKIWKTFRGFPRERRLLSDYIDIQKGTAGQFWLIWLSVAELSQAMNTLEKRDRKDDEDEKDEEPYQMLKKAMETARIWKQKEEMRDQCCW
ncbi:hypothetical protein SI65_08554 [Aspergillus cristatus]|uniref:Uncharacterized protein n=1 Tax=Aspergillus cristatus TaxID=573508 RepID=A0A1E3B577_ASPCR|nr:hypothetical protein SI65_08554 [Aspergillus cristatus]